MGFGLRPERPTIAAERGATAELERPVDPDGAGIADQRDPLEGLALDPEHAATP